MSYSQLSVPFEPHLTFGTWYKQKNVMGLHNIPFSGFSTLILVWWIILLMFFSEFDAFLLYNFCWLPHRSTRHDQLKFFRVTISTKGLYLGEAPRIMEFP